MRNLRWLVIFRGRASACVVFFWCIVLGLVPIAAGEQDARRQIMHEINHGPLKLVVRDDGEDREFESLTIRRFAGSAFGLREVGDPLVVRKLPFSIETKGVMRVDVQAQYRGAHEVRVSLSRFISHEVARAIVEGGGVEVETADFGEWVIPYIERPAYTFESCRSFGEQRVPIGEDRLIQLGQGENGRFNIGHPEDLQELNLKIVASARVSAEVVDGQLLLNVVAEGDGRLLTLPPDDRADGLELVAPDASQGRMIVTVPGFQRELADAITTKREGVVVDRMSFVIGAEDDGSVYLASGDTFAAINVKGVMREGFLGVFTSGHVLVSDEELDARRGKMRIVDDVD